MFSPCRVVRDAVPGHARRTGCHRPGTPFAPSPHFAPPHAPLCHFGPPGRAAPPLRPTACTVLPLWPTGYGRAATLCHRGPAVWQSRPFRWAVRACTVACTSPSHHFAPPHAPFYHFGSTLVTIPPLCCTTRAALPLRPTAYGRRPTSSHLPCHLCHFVPPRRCTPTPRTAAFFLCLTDHFAPPPAAGQGSAPPPGPTKTTALPAVATKTPAKAARLARIRQRRRGCFRSKGAGPKQAGAGGGNGETSLWRRRMARA